MQRARPPPVLPATGGSRLDTSRDCPGSIATMHPKRCAPRCILFPLPVSWVPPPISPRRQPGAARFAPPSLRLYRPMVYIYAPTSSTTSPPHALAAAAVVHTHTPPRDSHLPCSERACPVSAVFGLCSALSYSHGGARQPARGRPDPAAAVPGAQGQLLGGAGRRPVRRRRRRGAGDRRRLRALRVLQGRQPRRARGHNGPGRVRGRQVLRAGAGRQGPRRPGVPVRVRQQADRPQWRHGVARVPPPRRRRLRLALRRLPRPLRRRVPERAERVRGGGAGGGGARAGGDGGGPGHCGRGRAERHGDRRRERPGVPREPLPALPRVAGPGLQRHRLRRAHRPADHLRAALQRHVRPADRAPRRRAVGVRALRPRRLLR